MSSRTRTGRRSLSIHDANSIVSDTITNELIQRIQKIPDCLRSEYLKDQFLTKFVSKETDPAPVRRQRAINKWLATERDNEATNDRLLTTHGEYNILPRVTWNSFLEKLRSVIVDIIGETVPDDALYGTFSGGASTSRKRTESHPASKYLGQADITPAARHIFELALEGMPGWDAFFDQVSINPVEGNVLFTVPKNTTIDRCACKEPDLNMFLQKGAGSYIRKALRRKGINLNDQTRNQRLAREGSITGSLATLDLSSASDSVSSIFVELALPPLWFSHLNGLRSPITVIDGAKHVNEMFSSMGNGFTFELESLLFFALARTTSYFEGISGVVSVYGDDIICPRELAAPLIWVLSYMGFSTNVEKTFVTGSFRESCGGHYYDGYDVTPFYIRKPVERLTDLIHVANSIREWSQRVAYGVLDPSVESIWIWLRDQVPECLWGGREYSSITQLVNPSYPRKRLEARSKDRETGDGGYIHWLNTTWVREHLGEAIVTSSMVVSGSKYRMRPAVRNDNSCRSITPYISEM